jgi:hypothetical protein
MAPRKTVQDIFGLKPEEVNALTVLSGLEGFRGGPNSPDVAAVAANAIARRLSGLWGGKDIRNIAKAPGQYEAVFNYNMAQLADPSFGAKVLGGETEFNRLREIVNNPSLVGEQFKKAKGAQSFRGVSAYGNKKSGDYVPVPGKSNFYFNGLNQDLYNRGVSLFDQGLASEPIPVPSTPPREQGNNLGASLLNLIKNTGLGNIFKPQSSINPYEELLDPQSYLQVFANRLREGEEV